MKGNPGPVRVAAPMPRAARAHDAVMQDLYGRLEPLTEVVPCGSSIVYLDYPLYFNFGDMLINLGAERFFRDMDHRVLARLSLYDLCSFHYDPLPHAELRPRALDLLDNLPRDAILVLHGGGNFGDLYPEFQLMRELVIARFTRRRIVMLPQTAHFRSPDTAAESLGRLARHPDLHLFFRDEPSMELVTPYRDIRSGLLPDMAHRLWPCRPLRRPHPGGRKVLTLRRDDRESTSWPALVEAGSPGIDWEDLVPLSARSQHWALCRMVRFGYDRSFLTTAQVWYRVRDRMVESAMNLFQAHRGVVTDRLHGLILGALLSLPVEFVDNSYGKLGRYANTWLDDSPLVRRVGSGRVGAQARRPRPAPFLEAP